MWGIVQNPSREAGINQLAGKARLARERGAPRELPHSERRYRSFSFLNSGSLYHHENVSER
jgi:hypothetical protein